MTNEKILIYRKAHVELYEIIKHLSNTERAKIPENFIKNLQLNSDNTYTFKYDISKDILNQHLMTETKSLLIQVYIKYLAPKEEAKIWDEYNKICLNKINEIKLQNYDTNNLFQKENDINKNENQKIIVQEKNGSIFQKICNKILSVLKK